MEVDNESLEKEADNQIIEGLSVEQGDIVQNTYMTMVCCGKMFHIIIRITTILVIVTKE